jgi:hypothetical protein
MSLNWPRISNRATSISLKRRERLAAHRAQLCADLEQLLHYLSPPERRRPHTRHRFAAAARVAGVALQPGLNAVSIRRKLAAVRVPVPLPARAKACRSQRGAPGAHAQSAHQAARSDDGRADQHSDRRRGGEGSRPAASRRATAPSSNCSTAAACASANWRASTSTTSTAPKAGFACAARAARSGRSLARQSRRSAGALSGRAAGGAR